MPSKTQRARNQRNKKKRQQNETVVEVKKTLPIQKWIPEEPAEKYTRPLSIKKQKNPIWLMKQIKMFLPYEIVRYICLWCMILNEGKWKKTHKRNSKKFHDILSNVITLGMNEKIDWGNEKMYISPRREEPTVFFNMRKPCLKHREKYIVDDIITKGTSIIHLPRQAAEAFWIEDDDIKENYKGQRSRKTYNYIVHNKCRCYNCDIIRSAAVNFNVNFKDYRKYDDMYEYLIYDLENEQWQDYTGPDDFNLF